jgi:uncharacterized damage-inducible protein DinB
MIAELKQQNIHSLQQLASVIQQLNESQFTTNYKGLSGSSIGMHVRHILEFYTCLQVQSESILNYDSRERNGLLETLPALAIESISAVITWVDQVQEEQDITFTNNDVQNGENCCTSLSRELQYLSDHTVHHMAILKLIFLYELPDINIDPYFGYAFSTIKNLTQCAH